MIAYTNRWNIWTYSNWTISPNRTNDLYQLQRNCFPKSEYKPKIVFKRFFILIFTFKYFRFNSQLNKWLDEYQRYRYTSRSEKCPIRKSFYRLVNLYSLDNVLGGYSLVFLFKMAIIAETKLEENSIVCDKIKNSINLFLTTDLSIIADFQIERYSSILGFVSLWNIFNTKTLTF